MSPFFFRLLAFLSIPSLSLAPPLSSFSSASRRRSGSFSILSLLFHPQLWHFSAHDYKPKQRSTTSTTALKYQDIRQPLVLPCTKRSFSRISACLDRSMMAFAIFVCPMFALLYPAPSHSISRLRHGLACVLSFNLFSLGCQAVMQATFTWAAATVGTTSPPGVFSLWIIPNLPGPKLRAVRAVL